MELRIIRLAATLGFFIMVTAASVSIAGAWGWLIGALLFGGLSVFLWKEEVIAQADAQFVTDRSEGSSGSGADSGPKSSRGWE